MNERIQNWYFRKNADVVRHCTSDSERVTIERVADGYRITVPNTDDGCDELIVQSDSGDLETIICGTIEYFDSMEHLRTEYTKKFVEETTVRDFRVVAYLKDVGEYCEVTVRPFYYQSNGVLKVKPPTFHAKESYTPSPEEFGAIALLDRMFGSTVNGKGYKVLNPKVGLIYGDGMYIERYQRTLNRLEQMGYSASNLVIGVGGILRNHSRDTMGFAIKATYVEIDGVPCPIEKDPVTDPKKKSAKGLLSLRIGLE